MLDVRNLYVARDKKTGLLCLFEMKPKKAFGVWMPQEEDSLGKSIDPTLFPEVTNEDKKPTEVELVIKNKRQYTLFDKVYIIKNKSYKLGDLGTGGYNITYISLDKNKRDEMFKKLRQEIMNPKQDSPFYSNFEAGENSETLFKYFYGNWCYEYTIDEYKLENKQL